MGNEKLILMEDGGNYYFCSTEDYIRIVKCGVNYRAKATDREIKIYRAGFEVGVLEGKRLAKITVEEVGAKK